jgi:hypothetical protein
MSILPSDILRLLPQWLSWHDYFSLNLVSKLYNSIYPIPEKVSVFIEHWNEEPCDSVVTAVLGNVGALPPSPEILDIASKSYLDSWEGLYHCWWSEIYLSVLLEWYRNEDQWVVCLSDYCPIFPPSEDKCPSKDIEINPRPGKLRLKLLGDGCFGVEANVRLMLGDLNTKNSYAVMDREALDLIFVKDMIKDVSYYPQPDYPYLILSQEGKWKSFIYRHPQNLTLHDYTVPYEPGEIASLYIMIHPTDSIGTCEEVEDWEKEGEENHLIALRRVIAYVIQRMKELDLPLSLW